MLAGAFIALAVALAEMHLGGYLAVNEGGTEPRRTPVH